MDCETWGRMLQEAIDKASLESLLHGAIAAAMENTAWERMLQDAEFVEAMRSAACVPPAGMPPPPPIGQALIPPARGPAPIPELPYYTRGGYVICRVCNLATPYCKGHPRAPGSVAQDGDCDSTLKERIAECQDSK